MVLQTSLENVTVASRSILPGLVAEEQMGSITDREGNPTGIAAGSSVKRVESLDAAIGRHAMAGQGPRDPLAEAGIVG